MSKSEPSKTSTSRHTMSSHSLVSRASGTSGGARGRPNPLKSVLGADIEKFIVQQQQELKRQSSFKRSSSKGTVMKMVGSDPETSFPIRREDVQATFEFLDVEGNGKLRPRELKKRLDLFYPDLTTRDCKFLIPEGREEMSVDDLMSVLSNNELGGFDHVREAFKVYDPENTGYLDVSKLKQIMNNLGHGPVTDADLKILVTVADADGDGKIGLEDFRQLLRLGEDEMNERSMKGLYKEEEERRLTENVSEALRNVTLGRK